WTVVTPVCACTPFARQYSPPPKILSQSSYRSSNSYQSQCRCSSSGGGGEHIVQHRLELAIDSQMTPDLLEHLPGMARIEHKWTLDRHPGPASMAEFQWNAPPSSGCTPSNRS